MVHPSPAVLADSVVDVWRTKLEIGDSSLLSSDELGRARRFAFEVDRRRYIAGRAWLRTVLAQYVGTVPRRLSFRYGEYGKPSLDREGPAFNLAHSADEAVLAVSEFGPIGVDIEEVRPGVFDPRSAELVLAPSELATIAAARDRDAAFIRAWVRKEAYAKAMGLGLHDALADLSLETTAPALVVDDVAVLDLESSDGVVIAVAAPAASGIRLIRKPPNG
jgi:4'-phosphopantetheinyl transferase